MKTRDQKLAMAVYERVMALDTSLAQDKRKPRKQYGTMAHQMPILIRTAGLAQALAFVEARHSEEQGKPLSPQHRLINDLECVLRNNNMLEDKHRSLLAAVREAELGEYMRLTQHVLAALLWFKRYAQSVLNVQQGDEEGQREVSNDNSE